MTLSFSELTHLHPEVRETAGLSAEERIEFLLRPRWIGYTRAQKLLGELQDLIKRPPMARMPFVMVVGPTNNGKTMLLERFSRQNPWIMNEEGDLATIPLVAVVQQGTPDLRQLFSSILTAFQANYNPKDPNTYLRQQVHAHISSLQTRVLVIDELHNILSGTVAARSAYLNELRALSQTCRIAIVCAGIPDAMRAVSLDPQLENRFRFTSLPRWSRGTDYARFLKTLESLLPLREPSRLSEPPIVDRLIDLSEGLIGEVVAAVTRTAVHVLLQGREHIIVDDFKASGVLPPSQRRAAVERELPF